MKKIIRTLLLVGIITLIVIQFFQPERNISEIKDNELFVVTADIPEEVIERLDYCCFDCHSNNTRYPWYNRVAPISWMINKHVVAGKEELNFSEWGTLTQRKKISLLHDICEVIEDNSMPLESYLKLHSDAELTENQIEAICNWVELEKERLINE